jgi:hypothetical protein
MAGKKAKNCELKGTKHFPDLLCSLSPSRIKIEQKSILNDIFYALLSFLYSSGHTGKKNILYVYNSNTY